MDWVHYLPPLLEGAWLTIQLATGSTLLGGACAFILGIAATAQTRILRSAAVAVIEFFRGTSLLVQLFWLYFALPILGQELGVDLRLPAVAVGTLALSLNIGAYGAEVVRGALRAVAPQQREAALALNFSPAQRLWRIELPQAIPEMMPSFGNLAIQNLKDTALVSLLGLGDLTFRAEQIRNLTQDNATLYTLLLVMYFGMALILAGLMKWLERHVGQWRAKGD